MKIALDPVSGKTTLLRRIRAYFSPISTVLFALGTQHLFSTICLRLNDNAALLSLSGLSKFQETLRFAIRATNARF